MKRNEKELDSYDFKSGSLSFAWGEKFEPETKKCIKCGEFKTLDNYGYRSHGRDGTKTEQRNDCKSCIREQSTEAKKLKLSHPYPDDPDYKCPICKYTEAEIKASGAFHNKQGKKTVFRIDHDHVTKEFRGWICDYCNNGLSRFKDSPEILKNAIDYLKGE